jgi:hypothetical protein
MVSVDLLSLDRAAWERVAQSPVAFCDEQRLALLVEPDVLRTVGQQTAELLQRTGAELLVSALVDQARKHRRRTPNQARALEEQRKAK